MKYIYEFNEHTDIVSEITNDSFCRSWSVFELVSLTPAPYYAESYRRTKCWLKENFPEYFI